MMMSLLFVLQRDRERDEEDLGDFIDGQWQLTEYAPIDCDAHGLKPE